MIALTDDEKVALVLAYASPSADKVVTRVGRMDHQWHDRLQVLMTRDADLRETFHAFCFDMFVPTWHMRPDFDANRLIASCWPVYAHLIEPTLRKLEDA